MEHSQPSEHIVVAMEIRVCGSRSTEEQMQPRYRRCSSRESHTERFQRTVRPTLPTDTQTCAMANLVKAYGRKRQSGNVMDIVLEGIPAEVAEHRHAEEGHTCDACGTVMEEIDKEVRRSLKMEPTRFWIQEDVYYIYACKRCEGETGEGNLRKTPKRPVSCPGSFASSESVAHIMVQKSVMHTPLYRLEQESQRQDGM